VGLEELLEELDDATTIFPAVVAEALLEEAAEDAADEAAEATDETADEPAEATDEAADEAEEATEEAAEPPLLLLDVVPLPLAPAKTAFVQLPDPQAS